MILMLVAVKKMISPSSKGLVGTFQLNRELKDVQVEIRMWKECENQREFRLTTLRDLPVIIKSF